MPKRDRERILAALQAMRENPFGGDIAHLEGQSAAWRRRVGNWRIFFDIDLGEHAVVILAVRRRTSTTY
ncbi:MAG: type II toxin-antitoxin system RelE/ParE family toxin [Acidobacteria bacterium]|nr:type II toxin-antitoxin system RelE/ParE family toxin [Acidobacteriota bacterium]